MSHPSSSQSSYILLRQLAGWHQYETRFEPKQQSLRRDQMRTALLLLYPRGENDREQHLDSEKSALAMDKLPLGLDSWSARVVPCPSVRQSQTWRNAAPPDCKLLASELSESNE